MSINCIRDLNDRILADDTRGVLLCHDRNVKIMANGGTNYYCAFETSVIVLLVLLFCNSVQGVIHDNLKMILEISMRTSPIQDTINHCEVWSSWLWQVRGNEKSSHRDGIKNHIIHD